MKYNLLLVFLLIFNINPGKAQKYSTNRLNKNLTNNADVVVRKDNKVFKVNSISDGKLEVEYVVTILKKSGAHHSMFIQFYNKFLRIRDIKGVCYDKEGKVIKKIKRNDFIDVPAISGYSLYDDNRAIIYKPNIESYPYTIEYTYSIEFEGFLNYPSWILYEGYNISIVSKTLRVELPEDITIRSYKQNFDYQERIFTEDGKKIYEWSALELPAIKKEPYSPEIGNITQAIYLAPNEFKIGGEKGDLSSWKSFGEWNSQLSNGRNILNDETKEEILDLIKDAETERQKVEALYDYMQNKTRYVNISVGMGGWQPEPAEDVHRLGYGDCKALSNYMKTILKVAGIESYYTLVKAGRNAPFIIGEFPMNQFNHVIVCVPLEKDTMWLECTSQKLPAGYLGKFTDDRDVLLIKKDGSELVHTKQYSIGENKIVREINYNLKSFKNGRAEILTKYIGLRTDEIYSFIDATDKDIKENIYNNLNIPDFKLIDYKYSISESEIPVITENINLDVYNYGSVIGDRFIIPINLMNKVETIPKSVKSRKNNLFIRRASCEVDSINFIIPENLVLETIPEEITINSDFGKYSVEIKTHGNKISYKRMLSFKKGNYPPEEYEKFRDFLLHVSKADNSKFVLYEKTK